jgi:hypothetical protein
MQESASHRYIVGKGKNILIALPTHCQCSLILYQNLAMWNLRPYQCYIKTHLQTGSVAQVAEHLSSKREA